MIDEAPSELRQNEIFISYSRRNEDIAQKLVQGLKDRGIDPWFDREDIPRGALWWQQIQNGIVGANSFVFLVSPHSLTSEVCNWEAAYALEQNKRFIPVVVEDVFGDHTLSQALDPLNWTTQDGTLVSAQQNWQRIRQINFIFLGMDSDASLEAGFEAIVQAARTDLTYVEQHTSLLQRAMQWDIRNRQGGFLLTGAEANEAEEWLTDGIHKNPPPQTLQVAFIRASRRAQRNTQRNLLLGVSTALIMTIGLAVLAFGLFQQSQQNLSLSEERGTQVALERDRANTQATAVARERNISESLRLAALSMDAEGEETATLLGIRALASAYTAEAETSLVLALERKGGTHAFRAHDSLCCMALSRDDRQLLAGSQEGEIALWNLTWERDDSLKAQAVYRFQAHEAAVEAIAFSPDGRLFATGGVDRFDDEPYGGFKIWETATGHLLHPLEDVASYGDYRSATFAQNGSLVTVNDCCIQVWDPQSGEQQQSDYAMFLGGRITAAAVSPDLSSYVTANNPQEFDEGFMSITVNWIDAATENVSQRYIPQDVVSVISYLGQDRRVLLGNENGDVTLIAFVADDDPALVEWAGLFKDGTYVEEPFVIENEIHTFRGHANVVTTLAVSPNQEVMMTGSADGTARLWSLVSDELLRTVTARGSRVQTVSFGLGARSFLTAEQDGMIRLWPVDPQDWIALACSQVTRDLYDAQFDFRTTDSEWRQYNIPDRTPTCPQFAGQTFYRY
ncbi:MAG: TIR domain-containing protein [Anaerolineae bacterium]|nr:TIR domain-containing protein [Anaerolineae bacterium]